MRTVTCKRCERENEVNEVFVELHKCPQCENIKFDREKFFIPIEKQVIQNFRKAQTSKFGTILKSLYLFGSYAIKESKCGDIDFLITYSEPKLKKFTHLEIENFQDQFDIFFKDEYYHSELKSILKNSFWDFRTCQEYPDCLICYEEPTCKLPLDDYHSGFHTYCLDKCRNKDKNPIPLCCFDYCVFLEMEIRDHILTCLNKIIKDGILEFYEISPDLKIKVIDIIWKRKMKELIEEFKHTKKNKELKLYRINSHN